MRRALAISVLERRHATRPATQVCVGVNLKWRATSARQDYRRAGAPRDAYGTVVVGFRVRSDGAVDRCSVIRSSGYREFDQTTCRLIEQRFRYQPARDQSGQPIDWNVRTDFTWTPG